jgi:hypothetical protein
MTGNGHALGKTLARVLQSNVTGQVSLPLRSSAARRTAIVCPGNDPQTIAAVATSEPLKSQGTRNPLTS